MFFIIFKLPRTGSTRVSKYLSRAPGVRCVHEILNGYEGTNYGAAIEKKLDSIAPHNKSIGFTLNPFKHSIKSPDFFDPTKYIQTKGEGLVISLVRRNVFQQSVSYWLSTELKMWPGDSDSTMADKLQSHIAQGGLEIPPDAFEKICTKFLKQNRALLKFSREYSESNDMDRLLVNYEGIYQPPHKKLQKLESRLGISLDRDLVTPSKKLLPPPQDWIANYEQLVAICPPETG